MAEHALAGDWNVGVCLWVERQGEVVLRGPGAELLTAISRLKSITRAAKEVGMSYRTAWTIVQSINEAAGEPLVEAATGGTKGGGAHLTPRGEIALALYEQLGVAVRREATAILARLAAAGTKKPKTRAKLMTCATPPRGAMRNRAAARRVGATAGLPSSASRKQANSR